MHCEFQIFIVVAFAAISFERLYFLGHDVASVSQVRRWHEINPADRDLPYITIKMDPFRNIQANSMRIFI